MTGSSSDDSDEINYCDEVIGVQLLGYGSTSGILDVEDGRLSEDVSGYYNLNDQKITKPKKGIYIKNKR